MNSPTVKLSNTAWEFIHFFSNTGQCVIAECRYPPSWCYFNGDFFVIICYVWISWSTSVPGARLSTTCPVSARSPSLGPAWMLTYVLVTIVWPVPTLCVVTGALCYMSVWSKFRGKLDLYTLILLSQKILLAICRNQF